MTRELLRRRIEELGIIPSIRTHTADEATFAAKTLALAGLPIVEVTATVPSAADVIAHLAIGLPDLIVGAGAIADLAIARQCVRAGARFVSTTALEMPVIELARGEGILAVTGALTPTEVMTASKAGADYIRLFPCGHVGGASYIHALKGSFPDAPFIAAGGVSQQTAAEFIAAGAAAIGVGPELVPTKAIEHRDAHWITELARRFLTSVHDARLQRARRHDTLDHSR